MNLYRVTFTTSLLIEAQDDQQAKIIAKDFFIDEAKNDTSQHQSTLHIADSSQLLNNEHTSFPKRSSFHQNQSQLTAEQFLNLKSIPPEGISKIDLVGIDSDI
jgi:hypothetical protein